MIDYLAYEELDGFIATYQSVFTIGDVCKYLKVRGVKLSKENILKHIVQSENVFSLIDKEFITRNGVFTNRLFSFKPTVEEVKKGYFLLGHRCMPFVRPGITPDCYQVRVASKQLEPKGVTFSLNTVLDTYSLFGDGYILQNICEDRNNKEIFGPMDPLAMPTEVTLTAWPLKPLCGSKEFKYGDRILCRVIDWDENVVQIMHQPKQTDEFVVSSDDIHREAWYKLFEEKFLENFEKIGPSESIEQQLAFLFLENATDLCIEPCGSSEEFLEHTTKIGLSPYGVESRIWYANQTVPYIGKWNSYVPNLIISKVTSYLMPMFIKIVDVYLENSIYCERTGKEFLSVDEFFKEIFPIYLNAKNMDRNFLLLKIEKRRDILEHNYSEFMDYPIATMRQDALDLLSKTISLLVRIGSSGIACEEFPQQELIILEQLYINSLNLIDSLVNPFIRTSIEEDDPSSTVQSMYSTFEDVSIILESCLEQNIYKGFGIIKG